ncbi:transport protein [Paucilactobacillus suebicus DSM 5007 = KCTC 3549]|uniref:Transport protein n=2 Tax=Paucilactobacillus suebicus TaxID=152335 RepID=A0A0R1W2U0_9LACO|nr:transport protein [Paucilactobacillus suebicus DSM 5007 = KCTC 3549]
MRAPITSIPSMINSIAKSIGVAPTSLGILTTLPLICFGLFSPLVPKISSRLGNEWTIALTALVLVIGSYLRIFNQSMLFVGTILVGIAITFINVLLPALITENMPTRIGAMTSLYILSMAIFSSIGAGISAPIAQAINWQFVIKILTFMALALFIFWLPNLRFNRRGTNETKEKSASPWLNKTAWLLLLYFGLSSFIFYTLVAWLPTIAINAGISANTASLLAGLFQLASVPPSFFIPVLAEKLNNRAPLVWGAGISTIIGLIGILIPIHSVIYYVILNIILGLATSATFSLLMTLISLKTRTSAETSSLSGMTQSLGYLIAAVGPVLTGSLQSSTNSWTSSLILMIVITIAFTILGSMGERQKFVFNEKK